MTLYQFLNSRVALKFREDNLQSMVSSLQQIAQDGGYPIAKNIAVLTALANQNIDEYLTNYYYGAVYPKVLRERVLILLKQTNSKKQPNLQNIMKQLIEEYQTTGIGVYNEIKHMVYEGLIKIDNEELNNESVIEIS